MDLKEKLIRENLRLMTQGGKYSLRRVAIGESMGGNAGGFQGSPCVATNFYAHKDVGHIAVFGNIPKIPDEIFEDPSYIGDFFRLVVYQEYKIVGVCDNNFYVPRDGFSPFAREVLLGAARRYNAAVAED